MARVNRGAWNRLGLLVQGRQLRLLSTAGLNRLTGRRRVFLYSLPPAVEAGPNSAYTASTAPTDAAAEEKDQLRQELLGTRSEA